MAKYIDAECLKAEIERHIKEVKDAEKRFTPNLGFFDAKLSGIYDVMAIIDSLQQEQPSSSDLNEEAEKVEDYYDVGDEHGYLYCHRGDIKDAFIAGAKWQYQKDRGEFAKIKAKTWCEGFDAAVSRFEKISYEPRDWFSCNSGDFICGASFDEAIPAKVELYYKKEG